MVYWISNPQPHSLRSENFPLGSACFENVTLRDWVKSLVRKQISVLHTY